LVVPDPLQTALHIAASGLKSIGVDSTPFKLERDPGNPAADQNGMVKMPNVDVLVELADMREANRSFKSPSSRLTC
jgi:flagellar basal-body rod protein FlgC